MPGNHAGGLRAVETNKLRHGEDFYKNIGAQGGHASRKCGFYCNRELAKEAGRKGGQHSGYSTKWHTYSIYQGDELIRAGLTTQQVADFLGCTRANIYRLIKMGRSYDGFTIKRTPRDGAHRK